MKAPTAQFLCKLTDNKHGLSFGGFRIRDMTSGLTLIEVKDEDINKENLGDSADDMKKRVLKYHLGPDFLLLKTVGLTMTFSNTGEEPIKHMLMIERHYFREKVLRSYEFEFGFVMPKSTNSWEFIYDLPELTEAEKLEIIAAPWEVKSDSFFLIDGVIEIHNRAEYNYAPLI